MKKILEITDELGIPEDYVIQYGNYKAKIDLTYRDTLKDKDDGKLVLVTAITPTKAGEGKTTTTIGLHDGLRRIGINSLACLREPSLGPVWGIKGGAVGALKSSVVPSDDINLHFNGDFHALTATINLISAIIENHIYQGNELNIDPNRITWTRAVDINDRSLRDITINYTDKKYSGSHKSEYTITVASELMTIFCLAKDNDDFINRVNNIIVAYNINGEPIKFGQFGMSKSIMKMMSDAMNPNLVQTLEGNPVFIHGGPFANISIGVNSINATKLALKMSPVVVTEAGFGGDLGAEKFMDIACQIGDMKPSIVVLVATVRALKLHGGVKFEDLENENIEAMKIGEDNLFRHAENMTKFVGNNVIIAINRFPSDTNEEIDELIRDIENAGYVVSLNTAALDGSVGSVNLASKVSAMLALDNTKFNPLYNIRNCELSIKEKINAICSEIYRASSVEYSEEAENQIRDYENLGYKNLPVCISKTPNSFTDNANILNAPDNFTIHIREVRLYSGAGLIVPLSGSLLLMPGLPKEPRCLDKFN